MSAEYTLFAALSVVQVMEGTGCDRNTATMAISETSKAYEGRDLSANDLTDWLLAALADVRRRKAIAMFGVDGT